MEDGDYIHPISIFQAGVAKLNDAKELVDDLKKKAAESSKILAEKQAEADKSLAQITETMKVKHILKETLDIAWRIYLSIIFSRVFSAICESVSFRKETLFQII